MERSGYPLGNVEQHKREREHFIDHMKSIKSTLLSMKKELKKDVYRRECGTKAFSDEPDFCNSIGEDIDWLCDDISHYIAHLEHVFGERA